MGKWLVGAIPFFYASVFRHCPLDRANMGGVCGVAATTIEGANQSKPDIFNGTNKQTVVSRGNGDAELIKLRQTQSYLR